MNRQGHIGMTLLAFAPLAYVLASDGKLLLAIVSWLCIQAIEPLPDQDFHIPGLSHRGVSHSLLAVLVVGVVPGACGWLLGEHLFEVVYSLLSTGGHLWNSLLGALPSLSAAVLRGLVPPVSLREVVGALDQQAGENVRWSLTVSGFGVGAYGIFAHLLGDVITVRGVKPFLPISHWRLSLSSLRADSPMANSALFGLGIVAIALVVIATVPGVLLGASAPGTLSPVGVAVGENTTTQAPTMTQNASAADASTTITFSNQTANGSTVTVHSVTLSHPGYVAVQSSVHINGYASSDESTIAVSDRLSAGTHHNVTIDVSHAPPGNLPGLNRSQLNETETLVATVVTDSNENKRFDYVRSFGETDTLAMTNGTVVRDSARVNVPQSSPKTASVVVESQTLKNQTLVVKRAKLPEGGFLVVHNMSLQQGGDALTSVAGVSDYLSPGKHTDVGVRMPASALTRTQVVTVRPALDTNHNHRYDFIRSHGFTDVAYETSDHSAVINDTVRVRSPRSDAASATQASETTSSPLTRTELSKPRRATSTPPSITSSTTTTVNATEEADSDTIFGFSHVYLLVGGVVVLAVLPYLGRRLR